MERHVSEMSRPERGVSPLTSANSMLVRKLLGGVPCKRIYKGCIGFPKKEGVPLCGVPLNRSYGLGYKVRV